MSVFRSSNIHIIFHIAHAAPRLSFNRKKAGGAPSTGGKKEKGAGTKKKGIGGKEVKVGNDVGTNASLADASVNAGAEEEEAAGAEASGEEGGGAEGENAGKKRDKSAKGKKYVQSIGDLT